MKDMGAFLVILGTLGNFIVWIMFFIRLIAKKGWSYKRILALFIITAVMLGVGGSLISEEDINKPAQKTHKTELQNRKTALKLEEGKTAKDILEQAAKKKLGKRLRSIIVHDLLDDPQKKNVEIHFRFSGSLWDARGSIL
ncbi:MAG: hypothetical protein K6U80_18250, partial [Firmicutes bacterium]|nr:hypothetical protein [Bacillota bacterium]